LGKAQRGRGNAKNAQMQSWHAGRRGNRLRDSCTMSNPHGVAAARVYWAQGCASRRVGVRLISGLRCKDGPRCRGGVSRTEQRVRAKIAGGGKGKS